MIENTITTNENLVQDNSSTECVSPETNPITTIQSNELIFGQKHKDIDCALCPTAKRACDRAWVTAKQIEEWSKMPKKTLWRWLEKLEKAHRISRVSDMTQWRMPHEQGGSTPTTLPIPTNQSGQSQHDSAVSARHTRTESSVTRTPLVCSCSPNGRATFWTKCMKKTKRSLESTEQSKRKRLESILIGRDYSLCFHQLVGENENPRESIGECKHV